MTRSTQLAKTAVELGYFVVLKPRTRIKFSDLTNVSGNIYSISFTNGIVSEFKSEIWGSDVLGKTTTNYTEGTSSTVADDEFYYDRSTQTLYLGIAAGRQNDTQFHTATFNLYVATDGQSFNSDPTDSSSEIVYFEGLLDSVSNVRRSLEQSILGFAPVSSASVTLNNADGFFQDNTYDVSFKNCEIDIYHYAGDIETANFQKILTAIGRGESWTEDRLNVTAFDRFNVLDKQVNQLTYSTVLGANVDPNFSGSAVRSVYGLKYGFVPVNLDFNDDNPATSDNRVWGCVEDTNTSSLGSVQHTVVSAASDTQTTLDDDEGIAIGDSIKLSRAANASARVTAVSANVITHTAWADAGGAASASQTVDRSFVSSVEIVKDDNRYIALLGRDYTETVDISSSGVSGFTFSSSLESNLSMGSNLAPSDTVICNIRGTKLLPTISAASFGELSTTQFITADDSTIGVLANPCVIVYDLLRKAGIAEADIDTTSFQTTFTATQESTSKFVSRIALAAPNAASDENETYRELITRILQSGLLRLFINSAGKWEIDKIEVFATADQTVDNTDIISISQEFNYDDAYKLTRITTDVAEEIHTFGTGSGVPQKITQRSTLTNLSNPLNGVFEYSLEKEQLINTLGYGQDNLSFEKNFNAIFGQRRGLLALTLPHTYFDINIGDVVEVSRDKIPGFAYSRDTDRTRKFVVVSTDKSLSAVNLILDDQKGIEDADDEGEWVS